MPERILCPIHRLHAGHRADGRGTRRSDAGLPSPEQDFPEVVHSEQRSVRRSGTGRSRGSEYEV